MQYHPPIVIALWGALNGLLALGLAINVSRTRQRLRIGVGDGGHPQMLQAIRLHANNAEYLALALVLLAIIEILGTAPAAMHIFGALLLFARLLHAFGLGRSTGTSTARVVGVTLTWLVILIACGIAIYLYAVSLYVFYATGVQ